MSTSLPSRACLALAVSAFVAVACHPTQVPPSLAGPVQLTIENKAGADVCELHLTGSDHVRSDNLLKPPFVIVAGKTRELMIKADTYVVDAAGCNNAFSGKGLLIVRDAVTLAVSQTAVAQDARHATLLVKAPVAAPAAGPQGNQCLGVLCGELYAPCCPGYVCKLRPGDSAPICVQR